MASILKGPIVLLLLLLLSGSGAQKESASYCELANHLFDSFAKQAKQEFGITCVGTHGQMPYDIEYLGMSFTTNRRATTEEARSLEVFVTQRFAQEINNNEAIRPYLREYPFPEERTEISISFKHSSNGLYSDGSVMRVSHVGDTILYRMRNAYTDQSSEPIEESYTHAADKLQIAGITKPLEHETSSFEKALDEVFGTYKKRVLRKYKGECFGIGCARSDTLDEVHARFVIYQKLAELEKVKEIQAFATETLLDILNTNKKIQPYLREHPFPVEALKICLEFRKGDLWLGSAYQPGIQYARLDDGVVTYESRDSEESEAYSASR